MNIPFSMLKGVGGGKSSALLVVLAGLALITVLKNSQNAASATPTKLTF